MSGKSEQMVKKFLRESPDHKVAWVLSDGRVVTITPRQFKDWLRRN